MAVDFQIQFPANDVRALQRSMNRAQTELGITLGQSVKMAGSAVLGGTMSALGGGNFFEGALTSGLTAGLGDYLGGGSFTEALSGGNLSAAAAATRAANAFSPFGAGATALNSAARGAITGATGAALRGGDIGTAAVTGGVSSGLFPGSAATDTMGRMATGLLVNSLMPNSNDAGSVVSSTAPTAPTQPTNSSGWVIPETTGNSDAKALTARQQVAASLRSY
jgi:hypothetical protein